MPSRHLLPIIGTVFLSACTASAAGWTVPMDDAHSRPLLLTFGLHVTPDPEQNPIDPPERFEGFHTALDFEILPGEEEADVPVYAACDGEVAAATTAEGYGGVIVHSCLLDGEEVSVLYGHIDPESFEVEIGDRVQKGERIALLAAHKSAGSGDTRKHLHFGIHRGSDISYLGYVQSESELGEFIDPRPVLGL